MLIVCCLVTGCSLHPFSVTVVSRKNLQNKTELPPIDMNPVSAGDIGDVNSDYGVQIAEDVKQGVPCRGKYHPSYSLNHWIVVGGTMDNGRRYPVILDTGSSAALFVSDVHITENNLAIHPFTSADGQANGWGMCHIPKLNIGQMTLANWPCFYREQHAEVRLFGVPIAVDKAIIAGLPVLKRFKYVAFDSVKEEVEFSLEKTFEPNMPDLWAKYSFTIEEDLGGNAFLFVKIPVAGEETELQLDTGSGRGLAISEEMWEKISKGAPQTKLKTGTDLYPYIGSLPCRQGTIRNLEVGGRTVKNAMISVFADDSPLLAQGQGLLGMQYFRDTVIVLDFDRNLIWVAR